MDRGCPGCFVLIANNKKISALLEHYTYFLLLAIKTKRPGQPRSIFLYQLFKACQYILVCCRKAPVNRAIRFIGFWLNI